LIGKRASRAEEARLFSEERCYAFFKGINSGIIAINIIADRGRCNHSTHFITGLSDGIGT
jgi:hypothetical protein